MITTKTMFLVAGIAMLGAECACGNADSGAKSGASDAGIDGSQASGHCPNLNRDAGGDGTRRG